MPGFTPMKPGQKRRILIETSGPRTREQQQRFRKALLQLLERHQTRIVRRPARPRARKPKA